jgi:DNA-binding MarR family transcriptional regulator
MRSTPTASVSIRLKLLLCLASTGVNTPVTMSILRVHGRSTQNRHICLTNQTICHTIPRMFDSRIRRLLDAYPAIFLACHRQHVREDEAGKAVTEHQASVLDHLHATRPTTLSKLAEHMGVSRSTMSIMAARLVRGGYITRHRDKNDARCVDLTLTQTGARIKEQNTVLEPELMRKMFHLMPAGELETALQGMECLAKYARILLRQRKRGRDR